ncbi:lysylphosphatidylglycerol synthase domain-containing protein [Methylorubrum suomiense]
MDVRLGLLLHHLRALAQYRRLGLFRRPGALPGLHREGALGGAGRGAGGALFLHLRPRHDPARWLRAGLRSGPAVAARQPSARRTHQPAHRPTRRLRVARLRGALRARLGAALPPLTIRSFKIEYPRPQIMVRQLIAAPLELLGAAGIIYFALPDSLNPGFIAVLGIFLASFSVALASHAPGGLGVFELVFFTAMQLQTDAEKAPVLAALLIFRLFYLLIPFAIAIVVVVLFERARLSKALHKTDQNPPEPPLVAPGLDNHIIEKRLEKKAV